ncbi:MAG: hypothetical protein K9N07_02830 [Candidatus Cloacimonetes bacterium]|nr:hypothetical protein [Candidatus Cloacimonadota bacterium]
MKSKILLSMILLIGATNANSLVSTKLNIAHQLYMKSNYVMAIKLYDEFLTTSQNGALSTQAELERSDCYYQLGFKAVEKENWLLAARLFFLSNSEIADSKLDDCYFHLAQMDLEDNKPNSTLNYFNKITSYLKDSEHIPEVLYHRIQIYTDMGNNLAAFNDYDFLWQNYPDNDFTNAIQPFIDELMPLFINEALVIKDSLKYDQALDLLKKLGKYPSKYQNKIFIDISDLYMIKANISYSNNNYVQTQEFLDLAYEFDQSKYNLIDAKTKEFCNQIFQHATELADSFQFDESIATYKKCFILMPDYPKCNEMIAKTVLMKQNYQLALENEKQANRFEAEENYEAAFASYKKSHNAFATDRVNNKLYIIGNIIQAEKDPKAFAESIIKEFKSGMIISKVRDIEASLVAQYGDQVETSGWKVYYAIGKFKYEVRYDLLSPGKNYYFAWRVDLKTREVTSLNKTSDEIIKG